MQFAGAVLGRAVDPIDGARLGHDLGEFAGQQLDRGLQRTGHARRSDSASTVVTKVSPRGRSMVQARSVYDRPGGSDT